LHGLGSLVGGGAEFIDVGVVTEFAEGDRGVLADDRGGVLEGGEDVGDDGGGADRAESLDGFGADFGVGVLEGGEQGGDHHLLELFLNH
jgi:hypothetical protein